MCIGSKLAEQNPRYVPGVQRSLGYNADITETVPQDMKKTTAEKEQQAASTAGTRERGPRGADVQKLK